MSLDDIGNIGELIGAIGVIVTLIYLAIQIRLNTGALKVTSHQDATRGASDFVAQIAGDPDVARIFNIGSKDWNSLEGDERLRFSMILFRVFLNFQNIYSLHQDDGVDDEYWDSQLQVMKWFMSMPGVRRWWDVGKGQLRKGFVEFIEREFA
jgi:hypothetical protein